MSVVRTSLWPTFILLIFLVALQITSLYFSGAKEFLLYQRQAILSGEVWRLVSGQLINYNLKHTLFNFGALLLLWLLIYIQGWLKELYKASLWIVLLTGLGMLWFLPQVEWYLGMSGFLHGVALVIFANFLRVNPFLGVFLLSALLVKASIELIYGPISDVGIKVLVEAHILGLISGALYIFFKTLLSRIVARV